MKVKDLVDRLLSFDQELPINAYVVNEGLPCEIALVSISSKGTVIIECLKRYKTTSDMCVEIPKDLLGD